MRSGPGRGTLPSLKTTSRDLQPVGSPIGGARSLHVWPQGGNRLGADTLKPAQHPVSRPKASLDAQDMLIKGSGSVGGDLCTFCPPTFMVSLNGLDGGLRVPRKEVCQDGRNKEASQKLGIGTIYNRQLKDK